MTQGLTQCRTCTATVLATVAEGLDGRCMRCHLALHPIKTAATAVENDVNAAPAIGAGDPPKEKSFEELGAQFLGALVVVAILFGIFAFLRPSASEVSTQSAVGESSARPTGSIAAPLDREAESTVRAILNLQGQLCARITGVEPGQAKNTAIVRCVEYTGRDERVTYLVNLESATAVRR